MGISGLLPLLKPACQPTNVSQFKGQTFAIDVYCFLHKGAFGCAEQLVQGRPTDGYVKYVMKYVNLLLYHDIKPILVFDGRNLPSKEETEKKRRTARKENREKAVQLLREGRGREAKEYFQRCVDITPEMALDVIRAARERNVDCIVAPYEADAQLAFLAMSGIADIVVTEDSDLTLFGCQKILFKLTDSGDCVLYEREHLGKVFGLQADSFSFEKFRYMCITSGCDYLASLPGIGLGKAKSFWQKVSNPDIRHVLRKIPAYLKMPQVAVSQEYIERFVKANNTFLYQLVFDPQSRTEKPVTPYPDSLIKDINTMTYCGSYSEPGLALQMALGNVNIFTMKTVDNYDPDSACIHDSQEKPKYGARATHRSMWSKDFYMLGPSLNEFGDKSSSGPTFAFQMSKKGVNVSSKSTKVQSKGVEKRKADDISEDKVEEMLMSEESPPRKKSKADDATRSRKILGLEKESPTKDRVSKYFSTKKSLQTEVCSVKAKGRRDSTGDSGSWFSDIDKPVSSNGKFIYRPETNQETSAGIKSHLSVLQEISNSSSPVYPESEDKKQRRNPFAIKLHSSMESVRLNLETEELHKLDSNDVHSQERSSSESETQDSVVTISSSQLSMCSIDGESLTFSTLSQESGDNKIVSVDEESPAPTLMQPKPRTSTLSSAPRVGLSRPSTTNKSQSSSQSKTNFMPARVSGLSKNSKSKSNERMKQPSLLMFMKSSSKADFKKPSS